MNYYEHHIGDYAEATSHLSLLEDAVYSRMLRKYYATEKPLPGDLRRVQRLVGAKSEDELAAVEVVLEEFFTLQDDGYHNARCDRDIAAFQDGEPERELKKKNQDNRLTRHRDERSRLFAALVAAGGHADWNIKITELRELVRRVAGVAGVAAAGDAPGAAGPPLHPPETPATLPATAPATPATATQTPDTRHQTPNNQGEYVEHQQGGPVGPARAGFEKSGSGPGSGPGSGAGPGGLPGEAAGAMEAAGLPDVSATHPKLLALLAAGVSVAELRAAAVYAHARGAGFAYALARAEGQRRDAAAMAALPDAPPAAGLDPDSQAAVQAEAERLGLGRWEPGNVDARGQHETWAVFKARVRRAQAAESGVEAEVGA